MLSGTCGNGGIWGLSSFYGSVQEATRAVTGEGKCGVKGQMGLVFLKETLE